MKTIQRAFDYVVYGVEWIGLNLLQSFTAGFIFGALYFGLLWFTAKLIVTIFGEERAVSFITDHPYLFIRVAMSLLLLTGGLALFVWTRDRNGMEKRLRNRLAKHNPLFKVA